MVLVRTIGRLSREARRFQNLGQARYEARDLARRYEAAQAAIDRDNWEKTKVFKDPADQLWIPFLLLACVPLAVLFANVPTDLGRLKNFLSPSSQLTSAVLVEDLQTEHAILEYRDSLDSNEADAFTKPELWGQD
jgi:hypothetical protein